jgi:hypothetical protein
VIDYIEKIAPGVPLPKIRRKADFMDDTLNQPGESFTSTEFPSMPDATSVKLARPFVGFDEERKIYQNIKDQLLQVASEKFVVIVGSEVIGPIDRFEDALKAGYRRFGAGPLFVRQILADEPTAELSRSIDPCRI